MIPDKRNIVPLEIYTDGSCIKSGQNTFGGWSYCIVKDFKILERNSGYAFQTTNQRMELTAALEGLKAHIKFRDYEDQMFLYSDSAYLINCENQNWYRKWLRNGWQTSTKKEVSNIDLWQNLIPFFEDSHIDFLKVKGHSNVYYNNLCDEMAQAQSNFAKSQWKGDKDYAF